MEEQDFGERLRDMFPGLPEAEAMAALLKKYGSFRAIAKAKEVGASLATISRWGKRLGVTPPPPFPYFKLIRGLLAIGDNVKESLYRLKQEEGTWDRVAARLGVSVDELKRYRYQLNVVPPNKWKERQDVCRQQGEEGYWVW